MSEKKIIERIPPYATPIEDFPHMQPDFYTKKVVVNQPKLDENGNLQYDDEGMLIEETIEDTYENVYTRQRNIKEQFSDDDKHRVYDYSGGVVLAYRFEDNPVLLDEKERIIARHFSNRDTYITLDKKWVYLYDKEGVDVNHKEGGFLSTFVSMEEFKDVLNNSDKFDDDIIKQQLMDEVLNNPKWISYLDDPKEQYYEDYVEPTK